MDEVTWLQVVSWIWDHILQIVVVLSIFFEVSKIKLNPISWLMNSLFKPIRKDMADMKNELNTKIDKMGADLKEEIESLRAQQSADMDKINSLIEATEMSDISRIRWEIIEFYNSIENDHKHRRDEYRHIKDDYRRYQDLIPKYKLQDSTIDEDMKKINERYDANINSPSVYI